MKIDHVERSVRIAKAVRRIATAVAGKPVRLFVDVGACARALQAAERLLRVLREHARSHPLTRRPGVALEAVGLKADCMVTHRAIELLLSPETLAALIRELESDIALALGDELVVLKLFLNELQAQSVLRMLEAIERHQERHRELECELDRLGPIDCMHPDFGGIAPGI